MSQQERRECGTLGSNRRYAAVPIILGVVVSLLALISACRGTSDQPTRAPTDATLALEDEGVARLTVVLPTRTVPYTPTATPTSSPQPPTSTPTHTPTSTVPPTDEPTSTPLPSNTPTACPTPTPVPYSPTPSPTYTLTPTDTPLPPSPTQPPTATPLPTPTETLSPAPATGDNWLPNPSFEGGWYNLNGIPELQVPNQWLLEWDEGQNPLDPDPWNVFVRPETRVLSRAFLPPHEHELLIWDGDYTVKAFKGSGAISYRLVTYVNLPPGEYSLVINIFPDLVVGYNADGSKIWAPDPLSGEVRLIVGDGGTGWMLPTFGVRNTFSQTFGLSSAGTLRLGVGVRGRWAIENNGWFMDDWSLRRVD